jgi:hypothetical protein
MADLHGASTPDVGSGLPRILGAADHLTYHKVRGGGTLTQLVGRRFDDMRMVSRDTTASGTVGDLANMIPDPCGG